MSVTVNSMRKSTALLHVCVLAYLCVFSRCAFSEDGSDNWRDSSLEWMVKKQAEWSGDIVNLAHYIDGLMGDVEAIEDENKSYLRVYVGFEESRLYDFEEQLAARFSLDLPLFKKTLRLILENDETDLDQQNQVESELRREQTLDDESVYASFRYLFQSSEWQRLSFDYGVKVRAKPDLFSRIRATRSWSIDETWSFRFSEDFFWFESIGLGSKSGFDFDKSLNSDFLFRIANYIHWYERDSRFEYGQVLSLYQSYSEKRAMQYSLGFNTQHKDHHSVITNYFISVKYRRNLYKNWLYYQVTTGYEFPREFEYRENPFVALRLEVLFSEDIGRKLRTTMH